MRHATLLLTAALCGSAALGAPDCTFPGEPLTDAAVRFERLSTGFRRPVDILFAPDRQSHYFVVEQPGTVKMVARSGGASTVALEMQNAVDDSGNEMGLLGLAFHPRFTQTRRVFLNYTPSGGSRRSRISEMRMDANGRIDQASEKIILEVAQPYSNHNGGDLEFGPDGYLYIGLGDGGSGGDPLGNGQNLRTHLGKMLRIDVDRGTPYSVPADNPRWSDAQAKPEIYATGLRNPWRYSFDRVTGKLWAGDVGQVQLEEIDVVEKGGNYGWNTMEGTRCYGGGSCDRSGLALPVWEYPRSEGASITGGYVYRGTAVPELAGAYVYADYVSGNVWALRVDETGATRPQNKLLMAAGKNISSFGEDLAGELYALDHSAGEVLKIVPAGQPPAGQFPRTLSATGCFRTLAPLVPGDGLVPYEVNAPLWSDGADKGRFVKVPAGQKVRFRAQGSYDFPTGTVLVKHFFVPQQGRNRIVETRFLVKRSDGFRGYTYRWNDAETEATLLAGAATRRLAITTTAGDETFDYYYPSTGDCNRCHVPAAGGALGFTTPQLNKSDQLRRLATTVLDGVPADTSALPKLVDPTSAAANPEARARAYLHVQCANCHNEDTGTAQGNFDLRYDIPLASAHLCDEPPLAGDLGIPGAKIVKAGDSAKSLLWVRTHSLDKLVRMPPLASSRRDPTGSAVIKAWIDGLSRCN